MPRFARVRKLTSADLTADLAVKNLLDGIMIYSSGRFTGAFQQGKCFSLLHRLPICSPSISCSATI
jgi:ATP adenylyltransferase/5',5'''-P-1,P-4-tetraphosphate phosphorylase II